MKHQLLVVAEDESVVEPILSMLPEMELVIRRFTSFPAAIDGWNGSERPNSVLASKTLSTPGLLELLIALDEKPPIVPVIVLDDEDLAVPVPLGPKLFWCRNRISGDLPAPVMDAVGNPVNVRSVRRLADYLVCAMACLRSVCLEVSLKNGSDCLFEFVGGDLWNVYSDGAEGPSALKEIVQETVVGAQVRKLQMIPGERQIFETGVSPLGPGSAEDDEEFSTNELTLSDVVSDLKANGDWPIADKKTTEVIDFDQLLTQGIKASLARDYELAVDLFQKACALRPDDPRAKFNLEQVQRKLES